MAGVSPAAPYRHFRDRDELLSSIAQRGFEQFEALLTQAWDDGRPDTVTAFERVGKAYLAFARNEPAFYSAMFESGLPVDANPTLMAASERAFGIIRAAAERLAALAPPGMPRPPAMMMALHIWSMSHGVASLFGRGDAARRKLPMSPEDLLEAEVLIYLRGLGFPTDRRPERRAADQKQPSRQVRRQSAAGPPSVPGAPPNKLCSRVRPAARLTKTVGWFRYVNVIYIHNGVIAVMEREMAYTADVNRWRGPTEEPHRPHMLDSPWHPGWIAVTILGFIIWWPIGLALLFFTLGSRKMGCWSHQDRWQNKMERMQYKMERMRGRMERRGFRLRLRSAVERQPRLRRIPHGNAAASRGRAGRVPEFPRSPASRQGQGRVRPVHGAAQARVRPRRTTSRSKAEADSVFKRSGYRFA